MIFNIIFDHIKLLERSVSFSDGWDVVCDESVSYSKAFSYDPVISGILRPVWETVGLVSKWINNFVNQTIDEYETRMISIVRVTER